MTELGNVTNELEFTRNGNILANASRDSTPGIEPGLTLPEIWFWSFLFVTIINMSSIMGIVFFPLMKKWFYTIVMRTMIGLAIGSLSGSAFFHLIPAAFGLPDYNSGGQRYINIIAFALLSAWIGLVGESVIKIIVKSKRNVRHVEIEAEEIFPIKNNNPSENAESIANGDLTSNGPKITINHSSENDYELKENPVVKTSLHEMPIYHSTFSLNKRALQAMKENEEYLSEPKQIKTVAWIVIIGDSLHNFIDGISIGAGFVKSFNTGAVLALAVICEEFPHELGDFAILINSGLSVKKALLFNFMSALTCYLGMALGIVLGEIEWANYIFAFAAGIFLYVAFGDMVPEVTSLIDEVSDIAPHKAWQVLINHNIGIFAGVSILYLLALYQPE